MTEIRPGMVWLTRTQAAQRIGRSRDTITRWAQEGLITVRLGRIDERQLLEAQRTIRARRRRVAAQNLQVNTKMPHPVDGGAVPAPASRPVTRASDAPAR